MFTSLRALISKELNEIARIVKVCEERLKIKKEFAARKEEDILADSIAACLHSFYTGLESLFETIATELDEGIPKGDRWHKNLLLQMASEIHQTRCQVISDESLEKLEAYRAFRHLFRNLYTQNLNPDRIFELCSELAPAWKQVKKDIKAFLGYLEKMDEK